MRILPVVFGLALSALWSAAAPGQCLVTAVEPCGIDLHGEGAPRATASCDEDVWKRHLAFQLPDRFADADGNGWHEAVVELDLDPATGCGCAVFRIEIGDQIDGQLVNIGDSPTNDGWGGDADSTRFDAELMLMGGGRFAIYGSDRLGTPIGSEQILALSAMELGGRVVELEVCDQSVRFTLEPSDDDSGFSSFLRGAGAGDLLAIRRPAAGAEDTAGEAGADARIYAAINRVIHRRTGRPAQNRFGKGVRRVEITLAP